MTITNAMPVNTVPSIGWWTGVCSYCGSPMKIDSMLIRRATEHCPVVKQCARCSIVNEIYACEAE